MRKLELGLATILVTTLQAIACHSVWAAWMEVPLAQLDVTEGGSQVQQLGSGLIDVQGARFRATERGHDTEGAQLRFSYRGEVPGGTPTAGGDYRIQVGEKLLSVDPCNLVY